MLADVEAAQAGGAPVAVATVTHPGEPPLAERGRKLVVRRDADAGVLGTRPATAGIPRRAGVILRFTCRATS